MEKVPPIKRVAIVGAECTGKTTLVHELARHYRTAWVPEYVREFVDKKKSLPELADIIKIAHGQKEREAILSAKAKQILFCDTNLMMTVLYSDYYLGTCPPEVRQAAQEEYHDLVLFAQDDIPWIPDTLQRDGPEVRAILQDRIRQELNRRKIEYLPITGALKERLHGSIEAIDNKLLIR